MTNEIKTLRMNLLGGMDSYIREAVGDEDFFEEWIATFPDEATEDDLESIAEDEEDFTFICKLFGKIVRKEYLENKG